MSEKIDIAVLELLASKICHDLISPVGAVANGIEFLEELEIEGSEDIIELVRFSAKQSSAKLQAYRMAYGAGGTDSSIKPEDVHKTFGAFIEQDKKVRQEWDPYGDLGYAGSPPKAFCKMLMCMLLLAFESLPKGGEITVEADEPGKTRIVAKGENCEINPDSKKALTETVAVDTLEPRQMHAFATRMLSLNYGFELSVSQENKMLLLSLGHPAS